MRAIPRPRARRIGLSLLIGLFALAGFGASSLARDRHLGHQHPKRARAPRRGQAMGKAMKMQAARAMKERAAKAAKATKATKALTAAQAAQAKKAAKATKAKASLAGEAARAAAAKAKADQAAQKAEAARAAQLAKAKALRAKKPHVPTKDRAVAGTVKKRIKKKGGLLNKIIFNILFALCVCFSLMTITRKSPLIAALSLLVVFLALAGVYLFLQAPFMAVIQIIVYAGAVIVLFVFVIMSIGFNEERSIQELGTEILYFVCAFVLSGGAAAMYHFGSGAAYIAFFIVLELLALGIFLYMRNYWLTRFLGTAALTFALVQVVRLVSMSPVLIGKTAGVKAAPNAAPQDFAAAPSAGFGEARSIGQSVFTDNVFAFEALSLLLLAAIVAAVVIVRSRKEKEQTS